MRHRELLSVLLVGLCLTSCASMTEQERAEWAIQIAEHEPDRIEKWGIYEYLCDRNGSVSMLWNKTFKNYTWCGADCIPHRMDWDFYYKCQSGSTEKQQACMKRLLKSGKIYWRVNPGNKVQCGRWRF